MMMMPPKADEPREPEDSASGIFGLKKKSKKKKPTPDEAQAQLDQSYRSLFSALQDMLHPDGEPSEKEKLKLPPPEVTKPNSKTACVVNFGSICTVINRSAEHVAAFVQTELGTTSSLDEQRSLRVQYANPKKMEQLIRRYVRDYVVCQACKSLNTSLVRSATSRLQFLQCAACNCERTVAPIERGFLAVGRGERRRARAGGVGATGTATGVVQGSTAGVHCEQESKAEEEMDSEAETVVPGAVETATDGAARRSLVDEKQATLNIGIIGHVAHGKSSLVHVRRHPCALTPTSAHAVSSHLRPRAPRPYTLPRFHAPARTHLRPPAPTRHAPSAGADGYEDAAAQGGARAQHHHPAGLRQLQDLRVRGGPVPPCPPLPRAAEQLQARRAERSRARVPPRAARLVCRLPRPRSPHVEPALRRCGDGRRAVTRRGE